MTGDEAKGRIKKAAGELTGNKDLKREGDVDKASGKVKKATDKVATRRGMPCARSDRRPTLAPDHERAR